MSDPDPQSVGEAVLKRFMLHNDELKVQGSMLREKIREIIEVDPELCAREVCAKLDHPRSLRTVQWHLKIIRATRRHCASN